MRVTVNRQQMDWLNANCRFPELDDEQQHELNESIPDDDGLVSWQCPAFASVLVRNKFLEFYHEQSLLLEEMNSSIVSGTLNITLASSGIS